MKLHKNLLIGAVSALAISALPFSVESMASGSFAVSSAYAKGGNGGGNGGGHGGGHGSRTADTTATTATTTAARTGSRPERRPREEDA